MTRRILDGRRTARLPASARGLGFAVALAFALGVGPAPVRAADRAITATEAPAPAADQGSDRLTILFASGSAAIDPAGIATLDHASRLYRAGHPIVMVVSGATDRSGNAALNLALSERRARTVIGGLVDRGIPIDRLQLLAKGETDPVAPGTAADPSAQNRRVDITWR